VPTVDSTPKGGWGMKGLVGIVFLVLANVFFCVVMSVIRRRRRGFDFPSVAVSAAVATVVLHIVAAVEDIRSSQWLLISVPISLGLGLCVSGVTNVVAQMYIAKKSNQEKSAAHHASSTPPGCPRDPPPRDGAGD